MCIYYRFCTYRVFIKNCVISEDFNIFLTLFSLSVSVCTHTRQVENQRCSRTDRVQKNPKVLRKNTIFNEHPVPAAVLAPDLVLAVLDQEPVWFGRRGLPPQLQLTEAGLGGQAADPWVTASCGYAADSLFNCGGGQHIEKRHKKYWFENLAYHFYFLDLKFKTIVYNLKMYKISSHFFHLKRAHFVQ